MLEEELDELLEDALLIFLRNGVASGSLLQRKLLLGYNRAGRILDQLEMLGVVGPFMGSKSRELFINSTSELHLKIEQFKAASESEKDDTEDAAQLLKQDIIYFMKSREGESFSSKDIDGFLKLANEEFTKEFLEEMYYNNEIARTGNYRFYYPNDEFNKNSTLSNSSDKEIDTLRKLKLMLDEGLITEADYNQKKKQLLGL